jgi:hypothetical protein
VKYGLFIDHTRRQATLHVADCELFRRRGVDTDNLDQFWSAAHFESEDAARSAVIDRLTTVDGIGYDFHTHSCTDAASAAA